MTIMKGRQNHVIVIEDLHHLTERREEDVHVLGRTHQENNVSIIK